MTVVSFVLRNPMIASGRRPPSTFNAQRDIPGEKFIVELSNSTLTNIKGQQASKPDLTVTINRSDLETVMMGAATLSEQIKNGKAKLEGNREGLDLVRSALVWFSMGFEILPGTGGMSLTAPKDPFQQPEPALGIMTD